jgi:hypothetical protein
MIRATFRTRRTRALCFDLESRPSAFWYDGSTTAEITAIGWKWSHEAETHALLLSAHGTFMYGKKNVADLTAYEFFADVLAAADLVYGHNIRAFDLPLFQAGLLRRQLPPLPELRTTDTLKDYPKRKDMSASLENLADMYGLDEDGKKHMSIIAWERANQLRDRGIESARERVTSDVRLQEFLKAKLDSLGLLGDPRTWKPKR